MNELEDIPNLLQKKLETPTVYVQTVEVGQEFNGYNAITVRYEISVDAFANGEYETAILNAAKHTANFFNRFESLEKLSLYFRVHDDQITVEPFWFERKSILKWCNGQISDKAFLKSKVGYFHPPANLKIKL
jgi:hypothetical protein